MKLFGFTLKMWADDGVEPFPSLIREGPPFHTEKNGGDCYSKTVQTVTVLMAQN